MSSSDSSPRGSLAIKVEQYPVKTTYQVLQNVETFIRTKITSGTLFSSGEYLRLEEMIDCIWLEWEETTNEFKQAALSVRERILTKTKNSPTAANRINRIDATVCVMLSLQVN